MATLGEPGETPIRTELQEVKKKRALKSGMYMAKLRLEQNFSVL